MRIVPTIHLVPGDHVVQFYDRHDELIDVATGPLAAALAHGDTVIVVASPLHRDLLLAAIDGTGVDTDAACAKGQLVVFDAAETLAALRDPDGELDRAAFDEFVDAIFPDGGDGRPVHAFGEMVALLYEAGHVAAALQLEEWWCGLAERAPLSLLCGYPAQLVREANHADAFRAVCSLHTGVVGSAPAESGAEITHRFPAAVWAPGQARRFVADTMWRWGLDACIADTQLVVTELATNSIRHAHSEFTVSLSRHRGAVHVAVGDAGSTLPVLPATSPTPAGGRGLQVVAALASSWRCSEVPGGKLVTAELTPPRPEGRAR